MNEGNDVETADSMKAAIESHGGVKGCYASACRVQTTLQTMHKHTMTGVQSPYNFSYEGGGLRAWRAYNIGTWKILHPSYAGTIGYSTGSNKSYHCITIWKTKRGSENLDSSEICTTICC